MNAILVAAVNPIAATMAAVQRPASRGASRRIVHAAISIAGRRIWSSPRRVSKCQAIGTGAGDIGEGATIAASGATRSSGHEGNLEWRGDRRERRHGRRRRRALLPPGGGESAVPDLQQPPQFVVEGAGALPLAAGPWRAARRRGLD